MSVRTYSGVMGWVVTVYLVVFGLQMSSIWFALRFSAYSLFPSVFSKPVHREFVEMLLTYLQPAPTTSGPVPPSVTDDGRPLGYIVLCNHVNWSDFVLDIAFVESGVYVSRNVLKLVFWPGSYIRQWLFGDMIYFARGSKAAKARDGAKAQLYAAVTQKCAEGRSVIVYAEGTRNPTGQRMPLRVGLIKLAYEQQIPLYVSMTANKFKIMDESKGIVSLGQPIHNKKSPVVHPADYKTLEDFIARAQKEWDQIWAEIIVPSLPTNDRKQ